ncbi:MAG: ribosomal protein S18-alanine N-acetyltransferase [Pseudomonadota bacterium]
MTPARMARIHKAAFDRQRPWARAEFVALLQSASTIVEAGTAGFGLVRVIPPEAELLTLAVNPSAQRQGHGAAILRALIDRAEQRGATQMFLEVAQGNRRAMSLYRKVGFAETGQRAGYYRYPDGTTDDAVLMRRELHPDSMCEVPAN